MQFQELKQQAYGRWSDIQDHLPVLERFASQCEEVTEFGVRDGNSTIAFIAGCPGWVTSYDIINCPIRQTLESMELPCSWQFLIADTADPGLKIEPTDFLFFDTLHTYDHVKQELALHGRRARKFLGFHDTVTCGEYDRSGADPQARGILPAIREFLDQYQGEYRTVHESTASNGLLILERQQP